MDQTKINIGTGFMECTRIMENQEIELTYILEIVYYSGILNRI